MNHRPARTTRALLLCAAFGLTACSRPAIDGLQPADLILRNASVWDTGPAGPRRALAVREGAIAALGDDDAVDRLRGPGTQVVDLQQRTVLPAFTDHHIHLLNVGLSILNAELNEELFLDLSSARSPDEIGDRIRERASALPPGRWILGKGWSQGAWGGRALPRHDVLTRAAPDNPVFCARTDGHAGWVNLAALRIAGIDASTADPPGGAILRLPGGEPSGILLERANELLVPHLPVPSDDRIVRAFRLAAAAMAAQGVTEAFDAGFLAPPGVVGLNLDLERILTLLRKADEESPLPLRVNLMIPAPSRLADKILADPLSYRRISPRVGVTHIKLFCDGAFGSRGAFLTHPYLDDPAARGVSRMTEEELETHATRALDAGLDVAVHAIGDESVRRALNVYETLLRSRAGLDPGRLRIEHFSYASEDDIRRAAVLKVVLSIQPNFVAPDDRGAAMEGSRVGPDNTGRIYPWGSLLKFGAALAGGSDYFTSPAPPLLNFYSAATRANTGGLPAGGWHPEHRLPRPDALRLFTLRFPPGGGVQHGGSLRVGAPADLVVLSEDPLRATPAATLEIEVYATFMNGVATHNDGSLAGLPPPRR